VEEMGSWLLGTSPLWVILVVAVAVSRGRPLVSRAATQGLVLVGLAALAVQAVHFGEELLTGFYVLFPRLLGLPPWSPAFFVTFNVAWFLVWLGAAALLARGVAGAAWALWFLSLALLANGVAHPALSLAVGGYFPGLATSPFAGIAGLMLLRRLVQGSEPRGVEPPVR
jgi:hypothetical protein